MTRITEKQRTAIQHLLAVSLLTQTWDRFTDELRLTEEEAAEALSQLAGLRKVLQAGDEACGTEDRRPCRAGADLV